MRPASLRPLLLAFAVLSLLHGAVSSALAQTASWERAPVNYQTAPVNDAVAVLARKLENEAMELEYDEKYGYLRSVLESLEIPVSSQTLVFSKTSLQLRRISPSRPRALYFNDDVYVGYCQDGDVLELAATDPQQGAIFYTLSQNPAKRPMLVRDKGLCLSCHASSRTQDVPGYLVRSVFPDPYGQPRLGFGTFTTDATSEFENRWGGWYVTGHHGSMRHMGNATSKEEDEDFDRDAGANQQDLGHYFATDQYLSPHSDLVALMVLAHQTQMHNAIAAANYETRTALYQSYEMNEILERPRDFVSDSAKRRIDSSAEEVLRQLLFCDEYPLTDTVSGTSRFAEEFEARGKADSQGRSLRQFDLQRRLFRYPCSYLIHSDAFASLPDPVRRRILERLAEILEGRDSSDQFNHLTPSLRRELQEILRATLPEFSQLSRSAGA